MERIPAKLVGIQEQHSPWARMVHPHGNKETYQEASLMKQAGSDTSSTKKCKYRLGTGAGCREGINKDCQCM